MRVNPEIVELKFGCEVHVRYDNGLPIAAGASYEYGRAMFLSFHRQNIELFYDGGRVGVFNRREIEIIGRPIRLNDVLLAAGADGIGTKTPHDLIGILVLWDYWQDDLTEQSNETIAFLADLLAPTSPSVLESSLEASHEAPETQDTESQENGAQHTT